jgi:predicted PurR-regulated permease PerM
MDVNMPSSNGLINAVPQQEKTKSLRYGDIFYRTVIVLATLLGAYLLYRLGELVLILFIAIVVASAIKPLVEILVRRGLHRGIAILMVYVGLIIGLSTLLILVLPPLVGMMMELVSGDLLVNQMNDLASKLVLFGWRQFHVILPVLELPEQLQALLDETYAVVQGQAWVLARGSFVALGQVFLILVMGFYWLTSRDQMLNLLLKMSPARARSRLELIWNDIESTLGAYVRGQVILMLAIGIAALVGLGVLRVPYSLALAFLAGFTEAIPLIGPFLGGIPAVLLGLTVSPTTGLLVAGWYVLIQQIENHVLVPKVMQRNVGLNPLVVIIALAAGGSLNGIVGGLIAIPIAGALQVIARHVLIEPSIRNSAPLTENGLFLFGQDGRESDDVRATAIDRRPQHN